MILELLLAVRAGRRKPRASGDDPRENLFCGWESP